MGKFGEIDSADTCARKFPLLLMRGCAEGPKTKTKMWKKISKIVATYFRGLGGVHEILFSLES